MMLRDRSALGRALLLLFLIAILSYGLFEARKYIAGPELSITAPLNGALVHGKSITVLGIAKNISFISLNGRQIYVDEAGNFAETLLPPPGYTVLTVDVRDRFGRSKRESISLIVE